MAGAACGENVRCITGTTKTDPQLACFTDAADAKISRVATCNPALSDPELSKVADWYAAFLLVAGGSDSNLNISSRKLEQFEIKYGGTNSVHAAKRYFDVANDLSGGCLATLDKQPTQIAIL